jgi:acetyltransferase EpsM
VYPSDARASAIRVKSVVFAHAVINTGAQVGRHVVINSAVVIEHDAVIEDGTSLSPGVCMWVACASNAARSSQPV